VFLGESMAWDAGHFLQMCEADDKVVHDSIRRCGKLARGPGERVGKKRCRATDAT
jgi:hypothetical protein